MSMVHAQTICCLVFFLVSSTAFDQGSSLVGRNSMNPVVSPSSLFFHGKEPAGDNRSSRQPMSQSSIAPRVEVAAAALKDSFDKINSWLHQLNSLERTEPLWVGNDWLQRVSPSQLVQEHLQSLMGPSCPDLFPTEWDKAKFDWDWRYALLKLFCNHSDVHDVTKHGMSNTHPLRMQLVAVPKEYSLSWHVHPAIELDIPLIGTLFERRLVNHNVAGVDDLQRQPEHCLGTPISTFSFPPTSKELQIIANDLSLRIRMPRADVDVIFHEIAQGECLVNDIGSAHQSLTLQSPCLLLVLGPNVHANFDFNVSE